MTSPSSRSRLRIWMQMFWAICLLLVLDLGLFAIIKVVFHATEEELAGPFLAFVIPGVVLLLLAWRLREWELHSPSLGRLALGWGLSGALFFSGIGIALFYLAVAIHLLSREDLWSFVVIGVGGVLISSFSLYRMARLRISARADKYTGGVQPK